MLEFKDGFGGLIAGRCSESVGFRRISEYRCRSTYCSAGSPLTWQRMSGTKVSVSGAVSNPDADFGFGRGRAVGKHQWKTKGKDDAGTLPERLDFGCKRGRADSISGHLIPPSFRIHFSGFESQSPRCLCPAERRSHEGAQSIGLNRLSNIFRLFKCRSACICDERLRISFSAIRDLGLSRGGESRACEKTSLFVSRRSFRIRSCLRGRISLKNSASAPGITRLVFHRPPRDQCFWLF